MIPLFGVAAEYKKIRKELRKAALEVLDSGHYILGPQTSAFESEFALAIEAKHAISLSSGTDALEVALRALGVGPGDEVIVPTFTFVATAAAVSMVGATPVFCDVDASTLNIGVKEIEAVLTPKTKAVIPVHLYGSPANMNEIMDLAGRRKLLVIEDCAQAHLARWQGKPVGSFGHIAAFSFYPSKNLGALGDAGAITTNDSALADICLEIRNAGRGLSGPTYEYSKIAGNSRMAEIQAALLRVKLKGLKERTEKRIEVAKFYEKKFAKLPLILPPIGDGRTQSVFHLYIIRTEKRDQLANHLKEAGISCGVYYPLPLHRQKCYQHLNLKAEAFPNAEKASQTVLALPMHPFLSKKEMSQVAQAVTSFFKGSRQNLPQESVLTVSK